MYHEEPIFRNGALAGRTTSAMYGYTLGGAVALGYVHSDNDEGVTKEFIESGDYQVEIACRKYRAKASIRPMYDPRSERPKA